MSQASFAWSWRHAFSQSSLPPTTKHVLHTLGMFMNELGEGCYPSITDISRYSGLDRKTVLKHLGVARDEGWIAVSQHGFRGQRWKRQQYAARWPERDLIAACPPDEETEGGGAVPPPSSTGKVVELVPEGGGIEGSKVVEQLHQDKTSPVTTPVTSPVEREARGREAEKADQSGEDTPGRAAFDKRVMRLCNGRGFAAGKWEDWDTVSPTWISKAFASLSSAERIEAERWRDAYLLDMRGRKKNPVSIGNWLRGKMWTGLEPEILDRLERQKNAALPPEEQQQPEGWAACLGNVGMAWLMAKLLSGPANADLAARPFLNDPQLREAWPDVWWWRANQRQRGGALFDSPWHDRKSLMEFVPHGTEVAAGWRDEFTRRGWHWLAAFDSGNGLWMPKGGPDGLDAFEAAIRGEAEKHDGGGREEAE